VDENLEIIFGIKTIELARRARKYFLHPQINLGFPNILVPN